MWRTEKIWRVQQFVVGRRFDGKRVDARGGKVAVRNLTVRVQLDECFGFLGPNGAGKTTAISVWTGLYEASAGSASASCSGPTPAWRKLRQL